MKLKRYVLIQLLTGFLLSAAAMVFIAMPGIAVGAVHKLGGAGMLSVLKLVPLMVAVFVPYVLPVALLLSLVSTYGRLVQQNEWTAIRMAGMNPYRMLMPAMLVASFAGAAVYGLNAELLPRIKLRNKTLQLDELKQVLRNLSRGKTDIDIGGFQLISTYRDTEDFQTFYDCFIEFPSRDGKEAQSFFAEAVRFDFDDTNMVAKLYNARGATADVVAEIIEYTAISVSIDELTGDKKRHDFRNARYLTAPQLTEALERLDTERWAIPPLLIALGRPPSSTLYTNWNKTEARLGFAWHENWSNAATCLMFVLVGVSTGLLLRKGTQLTALAVAVGYAMVYWIASLRLGKQLAREGVLEPWVGAWVPLILFSIIGLWMTHRAFRE